MVRIIARLDIKGANLVKGIHLEGLKVLGPPDRFAAHYYKTGADEMIYMDAVASLYGRNSLIEIVGRTARSIFVPLTVGGGLRSLADIRAVLHAGADKVAINTAAIERPAFIRDASEEFGSSTIVVSVDAKRQLDGRYTAYVHNGRDNTHRDAFSWAEEAASLGAGEIMVTSIDRDGTGSGLDLELVRRVADTVRIPVIASGGVGNVSHVVSAVREGRADAVAIGSALHFPYAQELTSEGIEFGSGGEFAILGERRVNTRIQGFSIPELKEVLAGGVVDCRR